MNQVENWPARRPDRPFVRLVPDVQFARFSGGKTLSLNLLLPASDRPVPLILWIVGGAWVSCDPARHLPQFVRFAEQGYAVAAIEYRLAHEARFPAQIEDAKSALRFLRANADKYGIDAGRIGVWGNSAGGQLAALLGVTGGSPEFETADHLQESTSVRAVVDFNGPIDIELDFQSEQHLPVMALMLGGTVRMKPELARSTSPLHYLDGRPLPPFLILHGDADTTVPLRQSRLLHDKLTEAGAQSELCVLEGTGHSMTEILTRDDVMEKVGAFFDLHLKQ
ncbi:alpha/beta hydrolase [Saccharibacillus sp. CPCC 101409]|uniref:alpha/beta hydrolase n=1 Tax=Saccharibacillus sp. CPCC 101409 TaxID=3058041 RepID=UPI002672D3AC|nr:alpha/beta hydrolase [Saccharibacillus sp. CPCC 101409]MDO3408819.1 alpha/beta hydrolase [Saccharibacillus sp. CPCC 101409]